MTREMQKAIKERKAEAALLVRYANPKSKSKPTAEQVLEVLKRHIPYCGTIRPAIEKFAVTEFNRNPIQRSVHFIVELDNGKQWDISAYENLKGRTPEEKEADKTATFPSGLFNIFHDEIKAPEIELEQVETEKIMDAVAEYAAIVDGMATEYTNAATVETVRAEHPELDFMDDEEIEELLKHAKNKRNTATPRKYELTPTDGRKSFYRKAIVEVADDGTETLYSYDTPIIKRTVSGELVKLWDGWSVTTGRHIAAFCGLNKAAYMSL